MGKNTTAKKDTNEGLKEMKEAELKVVLFSMDDVVTASDCPGHSGC